MKKLGSILMVMALAVGVLAGCGSTGETDANTIETLKVAFVPSKEPAEIITATEPLKAMLIEELAKEGFTVNNVEITVGTSFEAVGEALSAGTVDIGFIPGGTYVLYDDAADVILTATRDALSIESDDAKTWNDNAPTLALEEQVTFYRSLIIAGPSEKGQALAAKVNAGEELTWEDLNAVNWSMMSTTSPAGYIYPSLWLQENYGKSLTDLANVVQADSYGSAMARLASGQLDVIVGYADLRRDNETKWESEFGRDASIWEETAVIGVTPGIYNDTVSVSNSSKTMTEELKTALQTAFINIGNTEAGKEVIAIYSHNGYQVATSADYDNERAAQELIKELNAAN